MRRRWRWTSAWSKPGFAPGGIAMKPTLARLTSGAFAGACDLVLAPGVERVVDRQRQLELAVVAEVEQVEPFGDREQAARLRGRVAIVGDIGAVHDPRQKLQCRLVERVLLEQYLERAEPVAVRVFGFGGVVGVGTLALGNLEHLLGRHVEELRLGIDEVLDQPRAGDAVGLRSFACDPLHARSPFLLVECKAGCRDDDDERRLGETARAWSAPTSSHSVRARKPAHAGSRPVSSARLRYS